MSASPPPGQIPPALFHPSNGVYSSHQTNRLAIWSFVCAFVFPPLGVIFGHLALHQIKRYGQEGHGLALAGLVCGYSLTVLTIIAIVLLLLALYVWYMITLQWVPVIPKH